VSRVVTTSTAAITTINQAAVPAETGRSLERVTPSI